MTKIIKKIREIIGNNEFKITIYNGEIEFEIYEVEVPITIDFKDNECYVKTEHNLTTDVLSELSQICYLLNENMKVLREVANVN